MKSPSIVAVCLCAALNASAASTSSYVQDGLIACWDGIENAGAGTHDAGATVWKDIVGGYEFALTGVTVDDDRMTFAGSATSYGTLDSAGTTATFGAAKNGTMEIVLASSTGSGTQVLLQSTSGTGLAFGFYQGKILSSTVSGSSVFPFSQGTATNSVSIRYSSSKPVSPIYTNGSTLAAGSGSDAWGSASGTTTFIGVRATKANNTHFPGSIYCIRLYNRRLTDEEIAANYEVDRLRFDAEFRNSALQVSSAPGSLGSPTPAYGAITDLSAGDTREVSCGATVCTNANRAYEYRCAGWKLYNQSDAVVASGPETSFTYTHPTPAEFRRLEWQWEKTRDLTGDWAYNDENIAVDDGSVSRIKIDGSYVYVFTNVESALTIKAKRELALVDCLLVGGGGGGGLNGGGGGAGGVLNPGIEVKLLSGETLDFAVGAGGAGGEEGGSGSSSGGNTTLTIGGTTYTAFGGGGGGDGKNNSGKNGGSGGGGFYTGAGGTGTPGQGYNGAAGNKTWGGGGGAGHAGYGPDEMDGETNKSGCGGDGIASGITGIEVYYGGGGGARDGGLGGLGGGGNGNPTANVKADGEDGTDGLGGGGGASFSSSGNPRHGGRGGNGTVILVFTPKPQGLLIYVR